ncbi:EF-hand domain-containing protein [Pseudoxanthomonas suwonensis]|uniref:EF-hand domain-containing protein n=1 Tax=Pseudoxanthomonas suwonensis TaxID=314722 RepID=A0A0E3Z5L5_9GAMM|nr:hypothetical protein [Pseudoxanthomonas suwonensis]AKC88142.1 hypothetical protein WQ53_02670 [Pseudoxanthomonas suwonensis]
MKKTPFLIAAALLAVTAGAALAQSDAPATAAAPAAGPSAARAPLDANRDGVIDRSEAAAHPRLAAQFDTLDKNQDGKLDRSEMPRRAHGGKGKHRGGHPFAALDKDNDGRISQAEAAADPKFAERFAKLDVNQDGYVDRADREQAAKQRRDAWFKAADSNNDGNLSKAEYDAAHAKRAAEGRKHGGWGRGPAADAAAK